MRRRGAGRTVIGGISVVGMLAGALAADEPPRALLSAVAQRESWNTAKIRYTIRTDWWKGQTRYEFTFDDQYSGEDQWSVNLGDRDGIRGHTNGRPQIGVGYACAPLNELIRRSAGEQWRYIDGNYSAILDSRTQNMLFDARLFGLTGDIHTNLAPTAYARRMRQAQDGYRYTEHVTDEGLLEITARPKGPAEPFRESVWLLDPRKGDSVVFACVREVTSDGRTKILARTESTYARYGGTWYVKTMKHFAHDMGTTEIIVHSASFNRPEHVRDLTPILLGMPVGAILGREPGTGRPSRYWDGQRVVEADEWERIKDQYDLSEYNYLIRAETAGKYPKWWRDESGIFGLEGARYRPGLWEDYVRRWGYKRTYGVANPLTGEQKAGAQAVLKDCQKRAAPIFQRIEKELAGIEKKLDDKTLAPEARQAASKKKADLTAPIEHIFTTQLVPRLEALLETRQTGPAASQPAAPTPGSPRPSP